MKKPNVFTDFHHASLLNSLIMLFEGRLGGNVYRPIGIEWAKEGYWNVYDHPFTQEQFLSLNAGTVEPPAQMYPDGTRPLNIVDKVEDGIYYCQDIDSGKYNKAITLEKFKEMDIDIVIASIPKHIEPFKRLIREHKPNAKLIYQIGNAWTVEAGLAPNVMASSIIHNVPSNVNFISYHQEFDLNIFKPSEPLYSEWENKVTYPGPNIYSFVNCFNIDQMFMGDWGLFQEVERLMPEWNFKAFGGQCRDGAAHGSQELADRLREARFVWHTKNHGDGYGHIIHNAAAVGRPLIVKKGYYMGKMGEKLMIDGETCIVIDMASPGEIARKIEYYSEPNRYAQMCKNVYENFKKVVDFDREFQDLQNFLNNLL